MDDRLATGRGPARHAGSPLRYALAPLWARQLATSAKSFIDNPLIGSRRLNARGLHRHRALLAARLAEGRRRRLGHLVTAADAAAFDRDGFILRHDALPPEQFLRLRDRLFAMSAPAREMVQGNAVTRRIAIDAALLAQVPELAALLGAPLWRGATRYVASFDSEPLAYLQTIFAKAQPGDEDPQTVLHSDTFHATMKAWLFLTDVAAADGPFRYVPGSHRRTPARLDWEERRAIARGGFDRLSARGSLRIAPEELAALGLPPPHDFAVPANTLIVADTSGFHARGVATRPSVRAEIWGYGRRNPFLPWTGLDLLSLPGVAERRVGWMWGWQDRFERLIGQPWRPVGHVRPLER